MNLFDKIKEDLDAVKKKSSTESNKDDLKVIIAELQRGKTKDTSDSAVLKVLNKFKKNELIVLKAKKETTSRFLETLDNYLPKGATKEDVAKYMAEYIDITQFKDKNRMIGALMKHFKGNVDGNLVREMVEDLYL